MVMKGHRGLPDDEFRKAVCAVVVVKKRTLQESNSETQRQEEDTCLGTTVMREFHLSD